MEDLASTDKHNARLFSSEEAYPKNIDPSRMFSARYIHEGVDDDLYPGQTSLIESVQYRLDKHQVKSVRKNSRVALEYVLTVNDQTAWENYSPSGFFAAAEKWVEDKHGKGSVVHVAHHMDESNPHMHIVVVPLVQKEVKWKNRNGEGSRVETRLNTAEYVDGRATLRKLQDDYHHFVKGFEKKMGVTFYRGKKAHAQTKEYIQQTNHILGRVRNLERYFEQFFDKLREEVVSSIKNRLERLKTHFGMRKENLLTELRHEQKIQRERTRKGRWKKMGPKGDQLHNPIKEKPLPPNASEERTEKNKGNGNQFGM